MASRAGVGEGGLGPAQAQGHALVAAPDCFQFRPWVQTPDFSPSGASGKALTLASESHTHQAWACPAHPTPAHSRALPPTQAPQDGPGS